MKKQYFNMVEVLLALGVVVIGICSVMVLFPVGVNANRDAAVLDDSSNTAEQALHFIAYRFTNVFASDDTLWNTNRLSIPLESADDESLPENESYVESKKLSEEDHETISGQLQTASDWVTESNATSGILHGADFTDCFYQYSSKPYVFQVISHRNPKGVKLGAPNFKEELVDYRAIMVLTKSRIVFDTNESGNEKLKYKFGFKLNAEISWPAERPYSQRKVMNYSIDIYRNAVN